MSMRSVPLLTVIGVALAGVLAPALAQQPPPPPVSSIRVSGDARVTAKPDRAQIDLGVVTRAPSSQSAAADNSRQFDAVLTAARAAAGPGAVLKTINYSLTPSYQFHSNGAEPTLTGYTATNVVRVTLDDLTKVGPVIDAATKAGANEVQGIQFTLRDEDAAKAQALKEAVHRARAKADVLADALGLRIVRVLSVEEMGVHFTPVFARPRAMAASVSASVATPVETGTLDISADVALSVEVAPAAH
jgi:uncharacterized protein